MSVTNSTIKPIYFNTKFPTYLRNGSLLLLFALLAVDFVFMGLHALKSLGHLTDPNFSVTKNFGYAETTQYLKAGFIAGCFLLLASRYKRPLFYCWGAIFLYVFIDDSLEVHEYLGFKLGEFVTRNMELGLGGTAGELIVFALFGLLLFVPLGWYFYKCDNKNLKIVSQDLFILFAAMVFFGMGVDILHDFAETGTVLNGMLGLIEDGGEMIVMSMIAWYTWTFMKKDSFFHQKSGNYRKKEANLTTDRLPHPSGAEKTREQTKKRSA